MAPQVLHSTAIQWQSKLLLRPVQIAVSSTLGGSASPMCSLVRRACGALHVGARVASRRLYHLRTLPALLLASAFSALPPWLQQQSAPQREHRQLEELCAGPLGLSAFAAVAAARRCCTRCLDGWRWGRERVPAARELHGSGRAAMVRSRRGSDARWQVMLEKRCQGAFAGTLGSAPSGGRRIPVTQ